MFRYAAVISIFTAAGSMLLIGCNENHSPPLSSDVPAGIISNAEPKQAALSWNDVSVSLISKADSDAAYQDNY